MDFYIKKNKISMYLFSFTTIMIILCEVIYSKYKCESVNEIKNLLISACAGFIIEIIANIFMYNREKRIQLENFLQEIIHSFSDYNPNLMNQNFKNLEQISNFINKLNNEKSNCNIEFLGNIYAQIHFFFKNEEFHKIFFEMYQYHRMFYDDLVLLKYNLNTWYNSKNTNLEIPKDYIKEFNSKYSLESKIYDVDENFKDFVYKINIYGYVILQQKRFIQKILYGEISKNHKNEEYHFDNKVKIEINKKLLSDFQDEEIVYSAY